MRPLVAVFLATLAVDAGAQQVFRCTGTDGKVTYQQSPCPAESAERKVDATPANTDYDPTQRERILKDGADAGRKLEAREAKEEAERARRQAQREADEKREREQQAREEAREYQPYLYTWGTGPRPPWGGYTPRPPGPRPQPVTPVR